MKYLLAVAVISILAAVSINAMAQDNIVYCKKMGDYSGRVVAFQGGCPYGWWKV